MKKKQGGDRQVVRLGLRLLTRLFWWNRTASITTSNTRGVREIKTNRLRVGERVIFFFFLFFFLGGGGGFIDAGPSADDSAAFHWPFRDVTRTRPNGFRSVGDRIVRIARPRFDAVFAVAPMIPICGDR